MEAPDGSVVACMRVRAAGAAAAQPQAAAQRDRDDCMLFYGCTDPEGKMTEWRPYLASVLARPSDCTQTARSVPRQLLEWIGN
jgi:hypothetical protein